MSVSRDREEGEAGARRALESAAAALGFSRLGIARAGPSPHADRFRDWLANGYQGTMHYMARQVARRVDPRETLPAARSVIVVALPYADRVPFPASEEPERGKIARYARGRDYHRVMPPLLRGLAALIAQDGAWKVWFAVDTAPILERDWAEAAGIGWIGKNGVVIDPARGSYFFLGVLLTDREYPLDPPATDHCGTCRACLDACPTGAIVEPRTIDARRCISYLTIEHRGEIEPALRHRLEGWVFGCDVCQEVCPYNRRRGRAEPTIHPDLAPRELPDSLPELAALDTRGFTRAFQGTAVMRARVSGLTRNARAVLEAAQAAPGSEPHHAG